MAKTMGAYDFKEAGELTVTVTLREYRDLLTNQWALSDRVKDLERQLVEATGCKPLDRSVIGEVS